MPIDASSSEVPDAWLDFGQAPALVGLSVPRFLQLLEDRAIPLRPSPTGKPA